MYFNANEHALIKMSIKVPFSEVLFIYNTLHYLIKPVEQIGLIEATTFHLWWGPWLDILYLDHPFTCASHYHLKIL